MNSVLCVYIYMYIYIYIRGVTVHKIHSSVRDDTVRYVYDTGGAIGYVAMLEIY